MLTYDYITDFAETADVCIPGSQHRLGTDQLSIHVMVPHADGHLLPYFLAWWCHIDPETYDVHIHLMTNRHRGVVLLTHHRPYTQSFENCCQIQIPASVHGFDTANLRVQIFSADEPAQVLLDTEDLDAASITAAIDIDSNSHDATITLMMPESGKIILSPKTESS